MRHTPHDHEAEAAVLAGAILRNAAMVELSVRLAADDFHHPAHRAIWCAMLVLHQRRQPIDPVTLEARLQATEELGLVGGLEGLGKISDRYASSRDVEHHAVIVADIARRRRVVMACRDVAEQGMGPVDDESTWVETAEQQVLAAGARTDQSTHRTAADVVATTMAAMQERMRRKDPVIGIPSGIWRLDQLIGGFQPGKLYVVAGRPGHGKSSLGGNAASRAGTVGYRGQIWPSLTINLEMSPEEVMERNMWDQVRLLTKAEHWVTDETNTRAKAGMVSRDDWSLIVRAAERLHQSPFDTVDGTGMRAAEIVSQVKRWRHGTCGRDRLPLVVVDYLQLIRPPAGKSTYNREQEVALISREMKILAKEERIPILLLCQLNRDVEDRQGHRPKLRDLRESGAIEQDADVIMFVNRPPLYMDPASPEAKAADLQAEIIVAKQRGGALGIVPCRYLGHYQAFVDAEEDMAREPT
jgi:replicative DNA helicase